MASKKATSSPRRKNNWNAEAEKLKARLEQAWHEGEHKVESMWHQSAVAALHWVSSHHSRVAAFRKAVKNTPMEKALDAAIKALRGEVRAPAAARTKARGAAGTPARKAVGKAARKTKATSKTARKTTSKTARKSVRPAARKSAARR